MDRSIFIQVIVSEFSSKLYWKSIISVQLNTISIFDKRDFQPLVLLDQIDADDKNKIKIAFVIDSIVLLETDNTA